MMSNNLIKWMGQIWCGLWRGHHNLTVYTKVAEGQAEWYLRCMHCTKRTAGWPITVTQKIGISNADYQDIHDHMMDVELSLHSGG